MINVPPDGDTVRECKEVRRTDHSQKHGEGNEGESERKRQKNILIGMTADEDQGEMCISESHHEQRPQIGWLTDNGDDKQIRRHRIQGHGNDQGQKRRPDDEQRINHGADNIARTNRLGLWRGIRDPGH